MCAETCAGTSCHNVLAADKLEQVRARDVLNARLRATCSENSKGIFVGRVGLGLALRWFDVVQIVLNSVVEGNALGGLFVVIQGIRSDFESCPCRRQCKGLSVGKIRNPRAIGDGFTFALGSLPPLDVIGALGMDFDSAANPDLVFQPA